MAQLWAQSSCDSLIQILSMHPTLCLRLHSWIGKGKHDITFLESKRYLSNQRDEGTKSSPSYSTIDLKQYFT